MTTTAQNDLFMPTSAPEDDLIGQPTYFVTPEGIAVDPETGEILGLVDAKGQLHEETPERPAFVVTTQDEAEWVLQKMTHVEAEKLALEARLKALTDNMARQIKEVANRLNWLHRRFDNDLRYWASAELEGQKKRSLTTPYGTLAFRRTQGSIKIIDQQAALIWCKLCCPDAVKVTESVLLSELKGKEDTLQPSAFEVTEPGENFSVKTGVGK